ncbi:uncharacterized protein PRCAT00006084001 [Priceomyces carsonii]|uniref:uncharacterized protein n=1 Tax=Priceomyces carsonii TaxID=28549 RepID=UPI002ED9213C|nr:unnamed protein product [Priceomyces carsonii]
MIQTRFAIRLVLKRDPLRYFSNPVCLSQSQRLTRLFSSKAGPPPKKSKYRFFKFGVALGLAGSLLYYTNDTARYSVLMAERVGVVTIATARCFNLYRKTLNKDYSSAEERSRALSKTHKRAAEITLKALETNGGIYIKLGQHITALTYLLPREWTETMIPLQDQCPRSSMEEIEELFITDMGATIDEIFSDFDPEPVGVASLAQVHVAKLKDTGEKVAVKVQHPSLAQFVPLDVYLTSKVFQLMYKFFPEYPLTWLGEEMESSIFVELNFVNEARNAQHTSEYFKDLKNLTALRIPEVKFAKKRILVMEYLSGARLDDLKYMKEHKINTAEVSSCLAHIFDIMIFVPGVGLHCDPHGGNLAIRPSNGNEKHNFEIILYDHGLYRNIPIDMKRSYSHFWLSILDNNVPKMKEYAEKFAGVKGDQKFKIFACAITGRDTDNTLNYDISSTRSSTEIVNMQKQLQSDGKVLEDLMYILSSMPRIVLLILKTNDLTRSLDENLDNPLGPERSFLILANYCAKAVYDEHKETISKECSKYSIIWAYKCIKNWLSYEKRISSLYIYDWVMIFKNFKHRMFE